MNYVDVSMTNSMVRKLKAQKNREQGEKEADFGLETVLDKDGNVDGMTKEPASVGGNTIEELKWTLTKMLESLDKDIIDET